MSLSFEGNFDAPLEEHGMANQLKLLHTLLLNISLQTKTDNLDGQYNYLYDENFKKFLRESAKLEEYFYEYGSLALH